MFACRALIAIILSTASSVSVARAAPASVKWPVPVDAQDGYDTGEVACRKPELWNEYKRLKAARRDATGLLRSGECYTLMSKWEVGWDNPKDITNGTATLHIDTKRHGSFLGYGQPTIGDD
ncbi:hypothetical protein AA23498_2153 [Acetobacter nitrogenifigens DSM 23921 = NBRC 105050]|uniref:Uncharacterized protein n=1 Tax=Acetobacter nitrogenifigens DSM 23921 = NBRC 105050 TaxID=1120919 RepID=A0A511X6S9_9PROT|nr:hypothetical protein AA23498_2153 [Acetobacter nitrogenifigens DSM 23921 = NBRC 105050]GEN58657.1 hypothetical protein ANI02nite_05410 [Acetobacter nitrogenifigens DSM 23921 = NBRC 105050]